MTLQCGVTFKGFHERFTGVGLAITIGPAPLLEPRSTGKRLY